MSALLQISQLASVLLICSLAVVTWPLKHPREQSRSSQGSGPLRLQGAQKEGRCPQADREGEGAGKGWTAQARILLPVLAQTIDFLPRLNGRMEVLEDGSSGWP